MNEVTGTLVPPLGAIALDSVATCPDPDACAVCALADVVVEGFNCSLMGEAPEVVLFGPPDYDAMAERTLELELAALQFPS